MIYTYDINGLHLKTGDLICTRAGGDSFITGRFWQLIGRIIPGEVDHIAIYIGPNGRCVESGPRGRVITFEASARKWNSRKMVAQRRFEDEMIGVAFPLAGRDLTIDREKRIRESVARYCLKQARQKKPYNFNFFNSSSSVGYYCSQLAYQAYLRHNIDLNTNQGGKIIQRVKPIVFPQEIWESCNHKHRAMSNHTGG